MCVYLSFGDTSSNQSLSSGADTDLTDRTGATALIMASIRGHVEILNKII